jgi:mRNA-degrading endonuclease RelE of RelBE toxin-antitoxin system
MYEVFVTNEFEEKIERWDKKDRESVEKIYNQLTENPYVGDQISYPFLREKKISGKRIYYLIYDDLVLVLMVATSSKKDQQKTINSIKNKLPEFRRLAEEASKRHV